MATAEQRAAMLRVHKMSLQIVSVSEELFPLVLGLLVVAVALLNQPCLEPVQYPGGAASSPNAIS